MNLETLYQILRKSKRIILNRLHKTYEVLNILAEDYHSFHNIKGIQIEFNSKFMDQLKALSNYTWLEELELHMPFWEEPNELLMV